MLLETWEIPIIWRKVNEIVGEREGSWRPGDGELVRDGRIPEGWPFADKVVRRMGVEEDKIRCGSLIYQV
jgi:hypothetical protein